MRKIVYNTDFLYAICVISICIGSFIATVSGIVWISMLASMYVTQEDPEEPEDPYESCTRMSEDLYLCDGEFCNPSTGVCNHVLPLD